MSLQVVKCMKVGVTCDGQGLDALAHEARRSNAGSAKRSILKMLRSPFHIMLAVLWFWNSYTIHCCCSRKTIHLAYLELVHYLSIYTTFYLIGPSIAFNLSFIGLSVSFIHISRSVQFSDSFVSLFGLFCPIGFNTFQFLALYSVSSGPRCCKSEEPSRAL